VDIASTTIYLGVEQYNNHSNAVASKCDVGSHKDLTIILQRCRVRRHVEDITNVELHAIIIRVVVMWVCNQVFEENILVLPNQDQIPLNVYP